LLKNEKLEDAGEAFLKLLRDQPDNTDAIVGLMKVSRFYTQQDKADKALEWLDRTLEIAEFKEELHIAAAMVHIRKKNEEKALEHVRDAVGTETCTPQILSAALTCLAEMDRFDGESREVAERLLSMQKKSVDAYLFLGLWHQNNDQLDEARTYLLRAVFLNTNDLRGRLMLGRLFEKTEEYELAEREYIKITKIAPDYFGGYLCLAELYQKTGDESRARIFKEEADKRKRDLLGAENQPADEPAEDGKQEKPK
ncbi:MAG: hypothetical protein HQ592_09845, partial [Planctomycetes bacterium]|nr:hypothetical protein [Planctomycetota bacterium]